MYNIPRTVVITSVDVVNELQQKPDGEDVLRKYRCVDGHRLVNISKCHRQCKRFRRVSAMLKIRRLY